MADFGGNCRSVNGKVTVHVVLLAHVVFHFLTRANAQWEIRGFTLTL